MSANRDNTDDPIDPATTLVGPSGAVLRVTRASAPPCPSCGAPPSRRVASQGFGHPHDVCGLCGFEFPESTV